MTTKKQLDKINNMTRREKLEYFCGGRVTVGYVDQVFEKTFRRSWVARIRGITVGNDGEFLHESPEDARLYGMGVMSFWKNELEELKRDGA